MTLRELAEAILRLPAEQQCLPALYLEPWDKEPLALVVRLEVANSPIETSTRIIHPGHPYLG